VILGGIVAVGCIGFVTHKAMQETPPSPWWTDSAHVVTEDTWMEPELDLKTGAQYSVVRPRPFAFVAIYNTTHPRSFPRALSLDPMKVAVPVEAVADQIERENILIDQLSHAVRGRPATPVGSARERMKDDYKNKPEALRTAADIQHIEDDIHNAEHHPKSHLQITMEKRGSMPAAFRDHTTGHAAMTDVVKMPDPFHTGPRGVKATGEDWESESSASSKSSYSDDGNWAKNRRRSKRKSSRGASHNQSEGRSGTHQSSKTKSDTSGSRSGTHQSRGQSHAETAKSGIEGLHEEEESSEEDSDGPDLPEGLENWHGLSHSHMASHARAPGAARMLRVARSTPGGTDGLHGGLPAICT